MHVNLQRAPNMMSSDDLNRELFLGYRQFVMCAFPFICSLERSLLPVRVGATSSKLYSQKNDTQYDFIL